MGQLLSQPLTDKLIEYHELDRFSYSLGSMQGYRLTQEDAHSVNTERMLHFEDFDGTVRTIDVKVFGIFDGHGGAQTSLHISQELGQIILEEIAKQGNPLRKKTTQGLVIQRIKNAFFRMDHLLYAELHRQQGVQSGSTAIVGVIMDNKELYTANSGDSRLIVSLNGYAKNLSFDHKPNHIGELIRINDAGGMVSYNRVGGVLALSRAFGDFSFKMRPFQQSETKSEDSNKEQTTTTTTTTTIKQDTTSNNTATSLSSSSSSDSGLGDSQELILSTKPHRLVSEETQVTVEPEIIHHTLSIDDEFIVLACDGIWDVFKNQDVVNFIRHNLALGLRLDEIASKLLEHSLSKANQVTGVGFDNMSMFIIACQQEGETLDEWYQRIKLKVEVESGLV